MNNKATFESSSKQPEAETETVVQTENPAAKTGTLSDLSESTEFETSSLTYDEDLFYIQPQYSGIAVENTLDPITLVPPLTLDRKICEIELKGNEPPAFRFELNQFENELLIIPLQQLNCEQRQTYQFELTFTDCSAKKRRSNRSTFFVVVYDVNEFVPQFEESKYEFSIESGERFSHIFEATDSDCDQTYSSICDYELILNDDQKSVPFRFSSLVKGKLQSTKKLDYKVKANYSFQMSAKDCGNKESKLIPVTVRVEPPCTLGWQGIKNVNLDSHLACLLPEAHFESCRYNCTSFSIETELVPDESGCILESDETRLQRCPGRGDNLLETGHGPEAKQIYTFYGTNTALEIVPIAEMMPEKFGFASWLQHESSDQNDRDKESVICETDKYDKNRHHFHLYLHNCNFGLTWHKKAFSRDEMVIETRTQFHWSTKQFCDANWHYVVLNVDTHSTVELYIDGEFQNISSSRFGEPFINNNQSVSWAVGACWHGRELDFVQHYEGKMASLNYIAGQHQDETPCDQKCLEYLDYLTTHNGGVHVINERRGGKSRQKLSGLENTTASQFEKMTRNVHYINTASYGNDFSRVIKVDSTAVCFKRDSREVTKFHQSFNISIGVAEDDNLIMRTNSNAYSYSNLTLYRGVQLFPEVKFHMGRDAKERRRIESCRMLIYPPLEGINRDEGLSLAEIGNLIMLKGPSGGEEIIRGPDSVEIFEQALSRIIYYSSLANKHSQRNFDLTCEDENKRKSNLVTIIIRTEIHTALTDKEKFNIHSTKDFVSDTSQDRSPAGPQIEPFENTNPHFFAVPKPLHARRTMRPERLASDNYGVESSDEIQTFDIVVVAMLTTAGIVLIVFLLLYSIYRSRIRDSRIRRQSFEMDLDDCSGCSHTGTRTHMFMSDSSPDLLTITENPIRTVPKPSNSEHIGFLINHNFVKSHTLHEFPSSNEPQEPKLDIDGDDKL